MSADAPPAMRRMLRALSLTGILCLACARKPGSPISKTTMAHGLSLGTTMHESQVSCLDGTRATVSPARGKQLLTFATLRDCASCATHLGLFEMLREDRGLPDDDILLVMVDRPPDMRTRQFLAKHSRRRVCLESTGDIWTRYDISHTPFTIGLSDGAVVYITDQTSAGPGTRDGVVNDITATLGGTGR